MKVISVENLSKSYRLGQIGSGTFFRDFERWLARARGRPDPYARIGEADHGNCAGEELWALRDVSFEVKQGEVLGIIGRNGAGKSTLLKILSRVTAPTSGQIRVRGRIASLLEVGTGFHPELTGRENIYLNGTLLGMTKAEIRRRFDEIVDFAGVERFIDTPVKRYSSGMYVRLAFAVAAHLEPEILVVDEVLAVGDAEFQKKCLGKMGDVARGGRTVLFVSHQMAAIKQLCQKSLLLGKGTIVKQGETNDVVEYYLRATEWSISSEKKWSDTKSAPGNEKARVTNIRLLDSDLQPINMSYLHQCFIIEIEYDVITANTILNLSTSIYNQDDIYILASPSVSDQKWGLKPHPKGKYRSHCIIPKDTLNAGRYFITILLVENGRSIITQLDKIVAIDLIDDGAQRGAYYGYWGGVVRFPLEWSTTSEQA